MNLYNLRILAPGHYQMAKFDSDFNVAAVYDLIQKGNGYTCSCPAGLRSVKLKPCKHQRALPYMLGALNTDRFYDIDGRTWHQPLAIHKPDEPAQTPDEAIERMAKCDYWNGRKSLSEPEPPAAKPLASSPPVQARPVAQPTQAAPIITRRI